MSANYRQNCIEASPCSHYAAFTVQDGETKLVEKWLCKIPQRVEFLDNKQYLTHNLTFSRPQPYGLNVQTNFIDGLINLQH